MRKKNQEYSYEFYDDNRIEQFLSSEFDQNMLELYRKLNIGAAKADFFRYAVLLKKGGIYLDIDSTINGRLNEFILPGDIAVISAEKNPGLYVQWALIFAPGHPFLKRTLELTISNIQTNAYPHDVHRMTGPSVYTKAVDQCIAEDPAIIYRKLGVDYNGHFRFKYPFSKLLYQRGEHWKKMQLTKPVLKPNK